MSLQWTWSGPCLYLKIAGRVSYGNRHKLASPHIRHWMGWLMAPSGDSVIDPLFTTLGPIGGLGGLVTALLGN